ncbi:aspartate kinase [Pseudobdellovibrio exovorus]|uniref:Aspartokinase n=1 Tax=Pseudobdellovibrio exovorus JSS TaxID=1184267 RepID=M4V9S6_9BACT|nr:aspartate kinase [Pseudobdellovibrio exovorus]AGH94781.1 aspartate kinase [Pseudobdellovibrio exovorus JSS]
MSTPTGISLKRQPLIVQKYGGATLADPEKIKQVAQRICSLHTSGAKVVVIVSAMGKTTNQLIDLAKQVSPRPLLREMDMLLSVGERMSMSLLSMALNDLGCTAISFTGSQAGILTDDSHVNANILEVKAFRVEEALEQDKVVILAGFQGVSPKTKEITTLGRGGSDISAVAIADYLKADRCEILKDVDSVYTADPKLVLNARSIPQMNYRHLLEMTQWGAKVLHQRSVDLAAQKQVILFVGAANTDTSNDTESTGTLITHEFAFERKHLLAINSYQRVFEIQLDTFSLVDFQKYLQFHQVGQIQILHQQNSTVWITAPEETLSSLQDFMSSGSHPARITQSELSSVSTTFTQSVTDSDLHETAAILKGAAIPVIQSTVSDLSLHFIVPAEKRSQAIQALHSLI